MEQIEFYTAKLSYEIDSWDLFELLEKNACFIIDARSSEAFEREHIPSAINIPHRSMTAETTKDLDKSKLYISYCDGIGCNASTKSALNMAKLGFQVKELLGGLDWWKRDGYTTEGREGAQGKDVQCGC